MEILGRQNALYIGNQFWMDIHLSPPRAEGDPLILSPGCWTHGALLGGKSVPEVPVCPAPAVQRLLLLHYQRDSPADRSRDCPGSADKLRRKKKANKHLKPYGIKVKTLKRPKYWEEKERAKKEVQESAKRKVLPVLIHQASLQSQGSPGCSRRSHSAALRSALAEICSHRRAAWTNSA